MTIIEVIELRTILDSRGNPTVEADVHTSSGFGRSAAPSGASTGSLEAKVKPPREAVDFAIQNVLPALIGMDATDQEGFDEQLRDIDGYCRLLGDRGKRCRGPLARKRESRGLVHESPALPVPGRRIRKGDSPPARECDRWRGACNELHRDPGIPHRPRGRGGCGGSSLCQRSRPPDGKGSLKETRYRCRQG